MRNRIGKFLLYAGLERQQYEKVVPLVTAENAFALKLAAVVQALYCGCSMVGSLGVSEMANKQLAYGFGTLVPIVILILMVFFSGRHPGLVPWLVQADTMGLIVTGLLCTLICTPDEMTILLLIFFFCVPMLFVFPPLQQIMVAVFADIIYFAAAPLLKAPEVLTMDMLDIGIFSTLSVILGVSHMHGRYRRYWLETEAVDLAEIRYQAAFIDQLTGAFNRNAYNRDSERLSASPLPADFMYIAMDLNGLKNANDSFGHVAGDELITGAVACMKKSFEECGTVYRTGGDEFVVMLNTKGRTVREILDAFNQTTEAWKGSLVQELSVSYGVVIPEETGKMTLREIELLADKRMYQAKSDYYKNAGVDRRRH